MLRIGIEGTLFNQFISSPIKLTGLIIQTDKDLSSVFKNLSVLRARKPFEYSQSSERIRPCPMSIAWWKNLDESSSVVTVDGHSLGLTKKFTNQQEHASPLAKCSLFKLYLQLMENLSPRETSYAQAKSLSSNSLRNEFMLNNPQWIQTDPNIFYSFTLSSSLSRVN